MLSLELSKRINSQIISADSRQIYKYLSIGTAKPTKDEQKLVKHHLIDFLSPDCEYNASKFEKEALNIISNLHNENIIPIVVGGSGLYVKALIDGIFDTVDVDEKYRKKLLNEMENKGKEYLFEKLKKVDPITAQKLIPQNYKRIIRALEVHHITGKPIWKHHENFKRDLNLEFFQFGLNWERSSLYENIEKRVEEMITAGLIDEVKNILELGYHRNLNALNTVGYKEAIEYLDNKISLDRAIELIKRNTRRYAKRQLTWFRKDARIKWFDVKSRIDIKNVALNIIKNYIK